LVGELVGLYNRANQELHAQRRDRFKKAAGVLCQFFTVLNRDRDFWTALEQLDRDEFEFTRLLDALDKFEDDQCEILKGVRVDEFVAAQLAQDLKKALRDYKPGSLPAVDALQRYVTSIGSEICEAAATGRGGWKLLARGLYLAGAIVIIATSLSGAGVLTGGVVAAGMQIAGLAAETLADAKKKKE
jgi:hypothetical protein